MKKYLILMMALGLMSNSAQATSNKIVLELFTSEGCSSCPPADNLLPVIARSADDIMALSYHVDYWDRLGWKDPFSSPLATAIQSRYNQQFSRPGNYTPQMVIQGQYEAIGSRQRDIEQRIKQARATPTTIKTQLIPQTSGDWTWHIASVQTPMDANLVVVAYDEAQQIAVPRGENAHRTLRHYHVVRDWRIIGQWQGATKDIPINFAPTTTPGGFAVIIQDRKSLAILSAESANR